MDTSDRFIPNPLPTHPLLTVSSPHAHLVASLTKLIKCVPPSNPWHQGASALKGLFRGPTSIAYLFLTLTRTHPTLLICSFPAKHWCLSYLSCGQSDIDFNALALSNDNRALGIGVSNDYLANHCILASITQSSSLAKETINLISSSNAIIDPKLNEYLRGRAGALALLRILKTWFPACNERVEEVSKEVISTMLENSEPWSFNGTRYLGAVHGDIGNLTQILLSDATYATTLESKLGGLLDMQLPSGNWPIAEIEQGKKVWDLVHFCHGAPGFVLSLKAIRPLYSDNEALSRNIDEAIDKAIPLIWEKGILKKQPNLCHGVVSNALALNGEQREHFMGFATEEVMVRQLEEGVYKESDEPWGLWWGEAGRAWGWMVLDTPGKEGWPGYSDI